MEKLNALFLAYTEYRRNAPAVPPPVAAAASEESDSGGGFFSWGRKPAPKPVVAEPALNTPPAVKGLYLYGGVGSGKTMIMDMFFDTVPESTTAHNTLFTLLIRSGHH